MSRDMHREVSSSAGRRSVSSADGGDGSRRRYGSCNVKHDVMHAKKFMDDV